MFRPATEAGVGIGVLPILLLALVTLAASAVGADAGDDRLGDARLFFDVVERERADRRLPVPSTTDGGATARRAGERGTGVGAPGRARRDGVGDGIDGRGGRTDDTIAAPGHSAARGRQRPRFEARLRVGHRVRVIVDGRPCRGVLAARPTEGTALHCQALPPGVEAMRLGVDGRLALTFDDGRRRLVAPGDAFGR